MSPVKKILLALCTTICFSISFSVHAAAPQQIVEGFGCKFNEGKGVADLNQAIDYYNAQIEKINSPELNKMGVVIWTPFRGRVDVDFVWLDVNMTLGEWAKATVAYDTSAEGQAADAKFLEVATCAGSGLASSEIIHATEDRLVADDGQVLIESYSCVLKDGQTMAHSDAAIAAWRAPFAKASKASNKSGIAFRRIPIVSGRGQDLSYVAVWADEIHYAEVNEALAMDPDYAKSTALFAAAHKCSSALWKGNVARAWDQ